MKIILIIGTIASSLFLSACESTKPAPTGMGPTSGVKSQSNHSGNTQGGQQ